MLKLLLSYKKNVRGKVHNYKLVSILKGFSKIYESTSNSLSVFIDKILSDFVAAYRKSCSSNHALIRSVENWKKQLVNKNIVGTVLTDLSKAFNCILHDLLIAKLYAHGFSNTLVFLYSYLKHKKTGVKIKNTESFFQKLLSGVPKRSILCPIPFNIFLKKLVFLLRKQNLQTC